jgi:lysophospholipase L1-like esterase
MGLRSLNDVSPNNKPGEFRIINLGDSFTEGIGVGDGYTWSDVLQKNLRQKYQDNMINVINAGQSGNDPIQCLHSFLTQYVNLKPDLVLLALNNSDINDVYTRGGNDRFVDDRQVLRRGPWWEIFYAVSFIIRKHVREDLRYSIYLIPIDSEGVEQQFARNEIVKCLILLNNTCKQRGIDFILIVMPNQFEMERILACPDRARKADALLDGMGLLYEQLLKEGFPTIFLPECYEEKMRSSQTNPSQYYWEHDFHHNEEGYKMFADCVSGQLNLKKKNGESSPR